MTISFQNTQAVPNLVSPEQGNTDNFFKVAPFKAKERPWSVFFCFGEMTSMSENTENSLSLNNTFVKTLSALLFCYSRHITRLASGSSN